MNTGRVDYDTALACYHSPEYAKAIDIRKDRAVSNIMRAAARHGSEWISIAPYALHAGTMLHRSPFDSPKHSD